MENQQHSSTGRGNQRRPSCETRYANEPSRGEREGEREGNAYPFVILDYVLADAGQRGPLAIVDGLDGAALVGLELAHLAAEAV